MKCACVASYFGPYNGNFISSLIALHDEMSKHGHEMCYVFPKEADNFEWMHFLREKTNSIYCIPYHGLRINDIIKLKEIFKKENVDLIYSRMCGWDFAAHFAAPLTPIVWHMDMCVNLDTLSKRIKNWIKFHILSFGKTYHLAVSNAVAEIINSLKPVNPCVGIPNALEFDRLPKNFVDTCKKIPYKILVFGWAPIVKGLDTVLNACEILNKDYNIIELIVSSQEKTYKYIDERYKEKSPTWLKLLPPTNQIADVYNQVDIMISASRSEGFSYCLAEAIYCGLPVVYSDISGTSWAREFQNTHRFKVADVDDLCRAIIECIKIGITHDEQQNNRDLLEKNYSMNNWATKIVGFLESIQI